MTPTAPWDVAGVVPLTGASLSEGDVVPSGRQQLADVTLLQFVALRAQPLPRNSGGKVLEPVLRAETDRGRPLR
jgi:hypothetical protein